MKRLQLFEFEDQPWFPAIIRQSITRMLSLLHGWLGTSNHVADILVRVIKNTGRHRIFDMCSGDGRLMIEVHKRLRDSHGLNDVTLTLSDLYPNAETQKDIAVQTPEGVEYRSESVDATKLGDVDCNVIRTVICGFHHMPPDLAAAILKSAKEEGDPILVYELSDNSFPPKWLWWVGLPLNVLFGFVVAASVRPMTLKHFVWSFVIPIVPLTFAWDGAVSNVRTYTKSDLQELLIGLQDDQYTWRVETISAKPAPHLYMLGMPRSQQ